MRSHIKTILLLSVVFVLLVWLGSKLNWTEVWRAVQQTNKALLALAGLLIAATYVIRAFRWRVLLAPLAKAHIIDLFAATCVGFGALFIIGRAGELARPTFLTLRDRNVRPAAAFITILVERIFDMAAMVVLFAAAIMLMRAPLGNAELFARVRVLGFLLLIGALVGIACLALFRRRAARVTNWLNARAPHKQGLVFRIHRGIVGLLQQLAEALDVLTDTKALAACVGWSALLWAVIAAANFCVLRAFGLPLGIMESSFVMGFSLVGSLVPTPGGAAGAYEAATMGGIVLFGVKPELALAASIVLKFVMFAPSLIFAAYFLLTGGVRLKNLRAAATADPQANADASDSTPEEPMKRVFN